VDELSKPQSTSSMLHTQTHNTQQYEMCLVISATFQWTLNIFIIWQKNPTISFNTAPFFE